MLDIKRLALQMKKEIDATDAMMGEKDIERYNIIMTYLSSIYHHFDVGELTENGRVFVKEGKDYGPKTVQTVKRRD